MRLGVPRGTGRSAVLAAAVFSLLTLTACTGGVTGDATRTPTTTGGNAPSGGWVRPTVGQCADMARNTIVDCVRPHDAEVTALAQFPPNLPAALPAEPAVTAVALPICRAGLAGYLGSQDADATNVLAWAFWPTEQDWARGERWLLCTVAEVGTDDRPKKRSGSLRGALAGNGVYRFQTCSLGAPSRDERMQRTACDRDHLGEALPGVIGLGRATDPLPHPDRMNALAQRECPARLAAYLGSGAHPEVRVSWRIPNAESWSRGYTNIVCYAEPARAVNVRLRGLGAQPLPA